MRTDSRSWVPPDGLDRARPREVRLTKAGRGAVVGIVMLLAAAVGCLVGLSVEAHRQARARAEFLAQAASTTGEVVRLWRGGGDNKKHAWAAYRFTVDGRTHEGRARIGVSAWRRLQVGDAVPVHYLPPHPRVSHAFGQTPRALPPAVAWAIAAVLAAVAAAIGWSIARQRHLVREGRAAPGRVTRHQRGHKGATWFFEFTVLSGARRDGRTVVTAQHGRKPTLPEIGTPICVLYDVDDDRRHAPYPLSLVETARKDSLGRRAVPGKRT